MSAAPAPSFASVLAPLRGDVGLPLHRQVENRLRLLVVLPEFQAGELLPDELTIANRLGVSRGTARAALGRLVQEGLLDRKAGVGTRVAQPRAQSGIRAWRSFSGEMAAKGIAVQNFSSEFRQYRASAAVVRALALEPGAMVQRLDRVRGWAGLPVLFSRSWLHPRLGLTGAEDFGRPLYELLQETSGVVVEKAVEEFAAVSADAAAARRLRVDRRTPLLLRRHTVSDAAGRPVEYAEVHYVSTRFTLTLDLRREFV
jgi:GntR family transcriptional regulator